MNFRTDLALERHELLKDRIPKGVESETYEKNSVVFTKIRITDESGAKSLGKPVGSYITAEIPSLINNAVLDEETVTAISAELKLLIPQKGTVLVVGLGNTEITPDAIGPKSVNMVLATRHITDELSESIGLGELRHVAGFIPGVLGKTGIETAESIKGIVKSINPCAVIVVDALAARRLARLGNTIQMSDTGIIPGSGVGNARKAINKDFLGVPVISMGIPTVVDAQTLVNDLTDNETEISRKENKEMIITPREIDLVVERASKIIAVSINKALQPHLTVEEILMLVGS
ncbi:MAG: GPR endopeptidase [Clostridia bacterium]|nr:GPR endopeptidase [Clostridia bacterium]